MTAEDAEDALGALEIDGWTDTIQTAMNSPNWQLKSDAVLAIGEKIAVRLNFKFSFGNILGPSISSPHMAF